MPPAELYIKIPFQTSSPHPCSSLSPYLFSFPFPFPVLAIVLIRPCFLFSHLLLSSCSFLVSYHVSLPLSFFLLCFLYPFVSFFISFSCPGPFHLLSRLLFLVLSWVLTFFRLLFLLFLSFLPPGSFPDPSQCPLMFPFPVFHFPFMFSFSPFHVLTFFLYTKVSYHLQFFFLFPSPGKSFRLYSKFDLKFGVMLHLKFRFKLILKLHFKLCFQIPFHLARVTMAQTLQPRFSILALLDA